jgi:hypothetical protein
MDSRRFDALARSLTATPTRRRLSQVVTGLALSGALAAVGERRAADAGKRKRTCRQRCPEVCSACYTRAGAPTLCGQGGSWDCNEPACSSDNACVGTASPYCVKRIEDRTSGRSIILCPDGKGRCAPVRQCG